MKGKAMFGTVARLKIQPGKEQAFIEQGERWSSERSGVTGQVASYLFKLEGKPDEFMMVAIFQDRESYQKNASDPETDRFYQGMRKLLRADPEWNDGEVTELPVLTGI